MIKDVIDQLHADMEPHRKEVQDRTGVDINALAKKETKILLDNIDREDLKDVDYMNLVKDNFTEQEILFIAARKLQSGQAEVKGMFKMLTGSSVKEVRDRVKEQQTN